MAEKKKKMRKCILFIALFLLNNAVQYTSCARLSIIPSLDSPCPDESTGEPCLTLQQYLANSSFSTSYNITLELYPGQHHLNSRLSTSNTNYFIMRATVNTASILCSQSSYFSFNQIQHFYISDIAFSGCRMNLNSMMNATFVRNSFMNPTGTILSIGQSSVQIKWCIFFGQTSTYRAVIVSNGNTTLFGCNISGFRITGYGGAVNIYEGRVHISKSNFSDNAAGGYGGAVYMQYGKVSINGCYFSNNAAGGIGYGGDAIYVYGASVTTISNSRFIDNIGTEAVGIGRGNLITMDNCTFSGNRVTVRGYGGGAIVVNEGEARLTITNCCFTNNTVGGHGGAVYMQFGREMTINNSCFNDNAAPGRGYGGGAIFSYSVDRTIVMNSYFSNNRAGGSGGAVCVSSGDTTITNNYFLDNAAGYSGSDVYVYEGGANITNNYFSDNAVGGHRAVYVQYGEGVTISKSYFCDNTTETNSGHSRGVYIQANGGSSIIVTNNTFLKRASGQGSTPIFYGGSYTSISLTDNTINYNTTAAYCGVLDIDEFYHCYTSSTMATIPQESMYHTCMQTNNKLYSVPCKESRI